MSRSTLKYANIEPTSWDYVAAPTRSYFSGTTSRGALYCHGSGGSALETASGPEMTLLQLIQKDRVLVSGDWGLESWGNDIAVQTMHRAVLHQRAVFGVEGPVVIACASMGFLTAANYARAYPNNVAAIAGIIPCVDIQDIIRVSGGTSAVINAAYPPAYNDATHGQTRSPIHMAERGLLPDSIKIKLWSLPSDTLTTPATQYAFANARPGTEIVDITAPGVYHGAIAVGAVAEEVNTWLKEVA